jgi:hypothetical protein
MQGIPAQQVNRAMVQLAPFQVPWTEISLRLGYLRVPSLYDRYEKPLDYRSLRKNALTEQRKIIIYLNRGTILYTEVNKP